MHRDPPAAPDPRSLASQVSRDNPHTIIFEVAQHYLDTRDPEEWSEPVQFRFEAKGDGTYDLVMRRVDG